jgi:hypothetical protein
MQIQKKMHLTPTEVVLGTAMCSYGLLKLFVGSTATFCSEETKEKITDVVPPLKAFYGTDETIASKAVESCFMIFGLYSLLHGLDELKILPHKVRHALHSQLTDRIVYGGLGVFLTSFYSAVIYTKLPIPKDKNNLQHYKLLGLVGGLTFLIMVPIQNISFQQKKLKMTAADVLETPYGLVNAAAVTTIALLASGLAIDSIGGTNSLLRDLTELTSITL